MVSKSPTTNNAKVQPQLLSRMPNGFPAGTEFSLVAVLPNGELQFLESEALQPYRERLYNEKVLLEAKAATGQKRMASDLMNASNSVDRIGNPLLSPSPEDERCLYGDGVSPTSTMGYPSKKSCRENPTSATDRIDGTLSITKKAKPRRGSVSCIKATTEKRDTSYGEDDRERDWPKSEGMDDDDDLDNSGMGEEEMVPLRVSDKREFVRYLERRFVQLQQVDCKVVAKAWIKVIEPKKQSRNPYNGGDATKPYWWPKPVIHREPDHLLKPDRIGVLIAILEHKLVPVAKLKAATDESPNLPIEKKMLLEELYDVVDLRNRFHQGLLDPNHIRYVQATMGKHKGRRNSRQNKIRLRKERSGLEPSKNTTIRPGSDYGEDTKDTVSPSGDSSFDEYSMRRLKDEEDVPDFAQLATFIAPNKDSPKFKTQPVRRQSVTGISAASRGRAPPAGIIARSNSSSIVPTGHSFQNTYTPIADQDISENPFFNDNNGMDSKHLNLNSQVQSDAYTWGHNPSTPFSTATASPTKSSGASLTPAQVTVASTGFSFSEPTLGMELDQDVTSPIKQRSDIANDLPILPNTTTMPFTQPQIALPYMGDAYLSYAMQGFTIEYPSLEEQLSGNLQDTLSQGHY